MNNSIEQIKNNYFPPRSFSIGKSSRKDYIRMYEYNNNEAKNDDSPGPAKYFKGNYLKNFPTSVNKDIAKRSNFYC